MEMKRPKLQRQQAAKKSMDDLYSKFAVRLEHRKPIAAPASATPTAACLGVSSSSPSTSSGFVNNPVTMNGLKKAPALKNEEKHSRICSLCKTKPLSDKDFVFHILGKKHSIAESKQKRTKLQKEERDRRTVFVSGFPSAAPPEKLCELFLDLGVVDFHWTSRHAFVELSSRNKALEALKKRVEYNSILLSVAPRTKRSHMDDVVREEPMETLLTPDIKNKIAAQCRSSLHLSNVLQQFLCSIELRQNECEKREYIRDMVAHCLRPDFPEASCHIFGSSANNLGFTGADLDLYAHLGYDPYDTPRAAEGETAAAKLVSHLASVFRRERGVSNVVAIPRARVPIVKFRFLDISVDLSFRNAMPIQNTALIKFFTSVHPSVRPYMLLVRFWAKAQNVAGGGKPATLLTNYALTMLMAFVIMNRRQILPSVSQLRNMRYRNVIVNGWNCGFSDFIPQENQQSRVFPFIELALDFFEYYADLDASQWVICPLLGRLVSKEDITSKSMKRLPGLEDYCRVDGVLQLDTALCVQDPFDLIHNITRGLTKIPLERFQLLCRRSIIILKKIMNLELPLKALFDVIELSDDAYSPDVSSQEHCSDDQDESSQDEPEVIEIDDDTADSSQEVVILEGIAQKSPPEREEITIDDDQSSHGIKRVLTDDSGISDVSPTSSISTSSSSLDGNSLSEVDLNSPYLYKFKVPSDKVLEVNMSTGAFTVNDSNHSAEDVRWSGLNILRFVLQQIFAANVISRITEGESPNKKAKAPDLETFHCIALLLVTFKRNLLEEREVLSNITPPYSSSTDSPFAYEKSLTDHLLKKTSKNSSQASTLSGTLSVQFFVYYRDCDAHELLLVANTAMLSESAKEHLKSFLQELRQIIDRCVQRALQCIGQGKTVL